MQELSDKFNIPHLKPSDKLVKFAEEKKTFYGGTILGPMPTPVPAKYIKK